MRSNHHKREAPEPLVLSHLSGIKRALLEGEKRPVFLEFLRQKDDRRGLYTLPPAFHVSQKNPLFPNGVLISHSAPLLTASIGLGQPQFRLESATFFLPEWTSRLQSPGAIGYG
jgi:hypothetical protein